MTMMTFSNQREPNSSQTERQRQRLRDRQTDRQTDRDNGYHSNDDADDILKSERDKEPNRRTETERDRDGETDKELVFNAQSAMAVISGQRERV